MWKKIDGTRYEVSINGEIRNTDTKNLIKGSVTRSGYKMVALFVNGRKSNKQVHRLVALSFIPNAENKPQVNHKDKNKLNNCLDNLEWVTAKENMKHHYDNGGIKRNNQTYKGMFGARHNRSIRIMCNGVEYFGLSEASRVTGISVSTIHYGIKNNTTVKGMHFELSSI